MDTENERNWELLTCLAYSYITFAGLTDGDLAEEEIEVINDTGVAAWVTTISNFCWVWVAICI